MAWALSKDLLGPPEIFKTFLGQKITRAISKICSELVTIADENHKDKRRGVEHPKYLLHDVC